MKQKLSPPFGCRLSLITILLAIAFSGRATTITWTNTTGGDWSVAANWSPNQVPGAADTAQITTSGNYTVTNDQSTTVSALTVGGGATGVQNLQVAGGAALTFTGNSTVNANGSLSVASGGFLQAAAYLTLSGPLTNAGTVNLTNGYAVYIYNNGSAGYTGGIVNQPGGVIDLWNNSSLYGQNYGEEYLVNQGTINLASGSGMSVISFYNLTNQAVLSAQHGTLQLQSAHIDLQSSGTLEVGLNSSTDYGNFSVTGNAPLNGSLQVQLNNGYIPQAGSSFSALSYGSFSGGFTGFSLPTLQPKAVWQPIYSSTALTLLRQAPINLLSSGTSVMINIIGTPGNQAILLTSTNLTVPFVNWTPVTTNTFDVTTYLGVTNNINPNQPRQFFIFKLQ